MVNLTTFRKSAVKKLQNAGNDSPTADTDSILLALGYSKSDIILGEKELTSQQYDFCEKSITRLISGEPVQYIVGGCEFMSLWFSVNPSTLIPRGDTEVLVEELLNELEGKPVKILDIGTGSGCIAISLAHYLPLAEVLSVDISHEAIETATKNAEINKVSARCRFEHCDIMKNIPDIVADVVVSNPPYIPQKDIEGLHRKVKDFEPLTALIGGIDGLDFYRRISSDIPLSPGGILAFEVGIGQADDVADIMSKRFEKIKIIKDLSGIDRVVTGILR